jgi:hypothetical protein
MSAKRGKKRERPFFKHGRVEYEPWGLERETKTKRREEMKKKKLRFSSRGSLRCYGPRSLVDEAIWLQAFKKLEIYGYHFFLLRSSSSRRVSSFFLFFGGLSLWSDSSFLTPASFSTQAADFEHEKKIIINK